MLYFFPPANGVHEPVLTFHGLHDESPNLRIVVTCTCGKVVVDRAIDVSDMEVGAGTDIVKHFVQSDRIAFVAHMSEVS